MGCAIDGCGGHAEASAPLPLCRAHLALAHDWVADEVGVADSLPQPCRFCGSQLGVRMPSAWHCAVCEWRHGEIPSGDEPPPRVDVVYYIRFDDRVKIGTSSNPRQRLGALGHEELLAFERGDRRLERRRHVQFAESRLARTEWFAQTPALDEHLERIGSDDPWSLHARWLAEALAARG